ncbi:aspartate-semialdehyde dehydrogenase [Tissierella sp. Yu-01]|uniref:aspartate-semialdehyde dehydrogenase n=1 Tax=Tissierella sp. Yu-01 TaxID=3035694 RepID=UPI00240DB8DC|nr:aspartate-semialdehyde dehydrogenase [Tissierella sp. Yu-01]WFA08419.1 aspartate-semialdehyde dehydrogenase [Tissierella sp. Yu-01]
MKKYNIAVVGATGLVGGTILKILEGREFPIERLYLLSSKKSAGSRISYMGKEYVVEELNEKSFDKPIDIALFAAGGAVSEKYAPIAIENGIKVIDNSSVFRMNEEVPLVIPEVNPEDISWSKGLVANPNCSTIQSVVPLKPLHDKFEIKRVIYSTYQSVSGSGLGGLKDLEEGNIEFYPYQIQYNALPHIDSFLDNGYTKEEMKMIDETKKILHDNSIKVTATTVRVPVKFAHSVSINIEFKKSFGLEEIYKALDEFPGIVIKDDIKNNIYPMAIDAEGHDEIYVGRIRRDFSLDNGVNLWVVADNIRKGAATNAVQIAELIAKTLEQED